MEIPDERSARLERLKTIVSRGINPYPSHIDRTHEIHKVLDTFSQLSVSQERISCAGRIFSKRVHGGSSFVDLDDGTGRIQLFLKRDHVVGKMTGLLYDDFIQYSDVGDFLLCTGTAFLTKKKERSLLVESWSIVTKALQPLPSQWYGIKDQEKRYRKRYIDMLLNEEVKEIFKRKAIFWNTTRSFLISKGFIEVYTPVLENTTGGADARPFITHHNALDMPVYLRISMGELWQKRLMIAGFSKTFEIGRQFRNEGIDPEHLQDYMQVELYMAYADYNDGMKLTEELIKEVAQKTFGTLKFQINGFHVDLGKKWQQIEFVDEIEKQLGVNVLKASKIELKDKLDELNIKYDEAFEKGRCIDLLWKQCRKNIQGPVYVIHVPVVLSPLAKRDEKNSELAERFQLILAGSEVCNGYSELNDPLDQHKRFVEQAKLRDAGDEEAQMNDKDFVEAMEYGMPPVCGLGFSERLFAFLEGKSVRECVMFPLMRPSTEQANSVQTIFDIQKNDEKINNAGISRDEALELLEEHVKNKNLIKHHLAAEAQLKALAEYYRIKGMDVNPQAWALAGLLHDIDWEITQEIPQKHSLLAAEILNKKNVHPHIIEAIRVHNHLHGIEPKTLLEKALYCAEELTGLIVAAALVQKDKSLSSLNVDSVVRKFKEKSFARGVNREIILKCSTYLDLSLIELIEISLKAMQKISKDLEL